MPLSTRAYLNKLNREVNILQDSILPVEYKYVNTVFSGFVDKGDVNTGPPSLISFQPLELTKYILPSVTIQPTDPQLYDISYREGLQVKLQNLTIRGAAYFTSQQHSTSLVGTNQAVSWISHGQVLRFVVFINKTNDPAISLTNSYYGGNYVQLYDYSGPYSPKSTESRFSTNVIYEKYFTVDFYNPIQLIDINIPLNFRTTWNDENPEAQTNALYISIVSDADGTSLPTNLINWLPYFEISTRLSFTDP